MNDSILKRLLKRYSSGSASSVERFLVDSWYSSLTNLGNQTPGLETAELEVETKSRMFSNITAHGHMANKLWYQQPVVRIAASLVLVSVLIWLLYPYQKEVQLSAGIYHTSKGQIKKITLADRTEIWMNGNSTLAVLPNYASKVRKVKLIGEAYFQVTHNLEKPFIIVSDDIETQVLGTSFNVSAYPKLNHIEVAVTTGKVSVSKAGQLLGSLLPGKGIQYNKQSHQVKLLDLDTTTPLNWRNGQVILDDVNFDELAAQFDNMFNLSLYSTDQTVKQLRFRLMLNKKLPMKENLKIITGIHHLKFRETNEHRIEIYK